MPNISYLCVMSGSRMLNGDNVDDIFQRFLISAFIYLPSLFIYFSIQSCSLPYIFQNCIYNYQWRRHEGNGWVRTPPLLFRPRLGFSANPLRSFFHILGDTPCMCIVTFYHSVLTGKETWFGPPTFLGLATPLYNILIKC